MEQSLKQYLVITANYWTFTLTDGALRMLVVLYFHQLGYAPLAIAMLFLFYEFFGVVTNLLGGYLGARWGLNRTMQLGTILQVLALLSLAVPIEWLSVVYVMAAQAASGIAKDLNKMSAKSAIKGLITGNQQGKLFKWVAILTGSKNALKGVGFFLGGFLLATIGFQKAMVVMAAALLMIWLYSLYALQQEIGKAKNKPKFTQMFSKSRAINVLSAARLFLFGARDVWFVVALPVYLSQVMNWSHSWVGGFLATWVIGYGAVQAVAPRLFKRELSNVQHAFPPAKAASMWAATLAVVIGLMVFALYQDIAPGTVLIAGLMLFGLVFAVNSSLHSFLIVHYADADGVSLDVGFYYMANAIGRLTGTVLSGWIYQAYGFEACLLVSFIFVLLVTFISTALPAMKKAQQME